MTGGPVAAASPPILWPEARALARRLCVMGAVAAYTWAFQWSYQQWVGGVYGYSGAGDTPSAPDLLWLAWVAAVLPSAWIPTTFERPSLLLFYVQYFFIHIPTLFVLQYVSKPPLTPDAIVQVTLLTLAGLSILQASFAVPVVRLRRPRLPTSLFWGVLAVTGLLLMAYTLWTLRGAFRLANLLEIYDVRAASAELLEATGSRLGFYAQMWLSGFFLPLAFALGVFTRRWWLVPVAGLGYLLLFGVGGAKTTLFSMVYIPLVYLALRLSRRVVPAVFAGGLAALLMVALPIKLLLPASVLPMWFVAIVHYRTFTLPGILFVHHLEFFRHNPLTYLGHVKGVNLLVGSPYGQAAIPYLIGDYYFGIPIGSNAGFWAGDGIVAFGPPGIVILSVVAAALFWVVDALSADLEPRFVAVASTFIAVTFANLSLATTALSGGLLLLLVALFFFPAGVAGVQRREA